MLNRDYHIYTGGQITWRFPIYLCLVYYWVLLGMIEAGRPKLAQIPPLIKHVEFLDPPQKKLIRGYLASLKKAWFGSSFEETIELLKGVQGLYVESVLGVPMWSTSSFYAYRKDLLGVVNVDTYGIVNQYTFMNAYKADGSPIRMGLPYAPLALNIMHSYSTSDYQVLDRIFTGLVDIAPYTTVRDQPWVAQDWDVGTWVDPEDGEEKSVVDFWLRKDVYWVEPETGDLKSQFTAEDYEFTCHYIYAKLPPEVPFLGCPHHGRFKDIYNVIVIDDFHVRVFMNASSYWALYWPTYPLLPKNVWLRETLAVNGNAYFEAGVNITLPDIVPLPKPVVSGSADTHVRVQLTDSSQVSLEWGREFTWTKGNLVVKVDSVGGLPINKVWVDYWRDGDARGYCPGCLDWREIMVGCGPYYITEILPGVGGHIVLKRNPYFFLHTPPLGEVDWWWRHVAGAKPRSGYYKVDMGDVDLAMEAYGTTGTAVPDSHWFPGADVQALGEEIDIYDIATICDRYGQEFGHPPP
jgi:hypothetical protein